MSFTCPHTGADEPCIRCDNEMLVADNTKLREEVKVLRSEYAKLETKLADTNRFFDSVRDSARSQNPDGCTILDFMAVWNEQYQYRLKKLERENEQMRTALKPFANVVEYITPSWRDGETFCLQDLRRMPRCGDYRRAEEILERTKP